MTEHTEQIYADFNKYELWEVLQEQGELEVTLSTKYVAELRRDISAAKHNANRSLGEDADRRRIVSEVNDNGDGSATIRFTLVAPTAVAGKFSKRWMSRGRGIPYGIVSIKTRKVKGSDEECE